MHSPYDRKKSFRSDLSVKVAFTGEVASYTYLAAKSFFTRFTSNATFHTVKNLQSMFQSILDGENIYGITPLESSSYGTIHAVYDRLLTSQGQFTIVGEIGQIEQHCLCVKASFSSAANDFDIARIVSHPHIMECCSDYLESIDSRRASLGLKPTERENAWDSTAGCEEVNRSSDVVTACICSKEAAELHGLRILTPSIGNYKNAETRYVIIAKVNKADESVHDPLDVCHPIVDRSLSLHEKTGPKCSIAMALRNIPGAIFKMSSCFAFRNLDIIKIESRPATISMQLNLPAEARPFTQKHWDLIFYIDYEPSDNNEVNDSLLRNLSEYCLWIRHLGSYQSGLHSLDQQPSEWHSIVEVVSC